MEQKLNNCLICGSQCLGEYCVPCGHVLDNLERFLSFEKGRLFLFDSVSKALYESTPGNLVPESRLHRDTRQYFSDRLMPLLYWGPAPKVPILTMECYEKWYEMWLVKPDGSVQKEDWTVLEELCKNSDTAWRDHVPNPKVVQRLCELRGWWFHELAQEVMTARFKGK